jgi:hypothetical protein
MSADLQRTVRITLRSFPRDPAAAGDTVQETPTARAGLEIPRKIRAISVEGALANTPRVGREKQRLAAPA